VTEEIFWEVNRARRGNNGATQHSDGSRQRGQACVSVLVRMSECALCVSFIFLFSFLCFYQNIQIIIKLETCHYFLGYFALYHWNSHGLEMYHYNSSYWKYVIGSLELLASLRNPILYVCSRLGPIVRWSYFRMDVFAPVSILIEAS
jgi:hypothetical protein